MSRDWRDFRLLHLPRGGLRSCSATSQERTAAALLASLLQGIFSANALVTATRRSSEPANRHLCPAIEARFATAVYAVLDRRGRLTYCNAGHIHPSLSGEWCPATRVRGMVVGAFERAIFDERTHHSSPATCCGIQ